MVPRQVPAPYWFDVKGQLARDAACSVVQFVFAVSRLMWTRETFRRGLNRARQLASSRWSAMLGIPIVRRLRGHQLRRLRPLANGRQRGRPVVRYYWERFLEANRSDIRGRCLEIGSTVAIRRHGGQAVSQADALDVTRHSEAITVVADLSRADSLPGDTYDCFINPFTMHLIYDVEAALYHSIRVLKPGGVLLVNFPCVDYYFARGLDMGTGRPLFVYWWFTPIQVENLFRRVGLKSRRVSGPNRRQPLHARGVPDEHADGGIVSCGARSRRRGSSLAHQRACREAHELAGGAARIPGSVDPQRHSSSVEPLDGALSGGEF